MKLDSGARDKFGPAAAAVEPDNPPEKRAGPLFFRSKDLRHGRPSLDLGAARGY
jgi:hypothetical protein